MRVYRQRADVVAELLEADPAEQRRRRLFECGEVIACYGDYADVRVGEDGNGQPLVLQGVHVIAGYRPALGSWVTLRYQNDRPGAPVAVGPALTEGECPDQPQSPQEVEAARSSTSFGQFDSLQERLEGAEAALLSEFGAEGHNHTGAAGEGRRLAQAATHEQADTDTAPSALHHTLGSGANQAAAGNHGHAGLHDRQHALASALDHTGYLWTAPRHNLHWLLATVCERLLQGTLDSGNPTPTAVTYGALANTGIFAWNPALGEWAATADAYYSSAPGAWVELVTRTASGTVTLNRGTSATNADQAIAVYLDGTLHGTWNQGLGGSNQYYSLSGLAAGVHTIRCLRNADADNDRLYFAGATCPQLPYQGVGVAGDTFTILLGADCFGITTAGTGPTNNGGVLASDYAPAITPKLPMPASFGDTACDRNSISLAGLTLPTTTAALARVPIAHLGGGTYAPLAAGLSMSLSSTAETRGYRITSGIYGITALTVLGASMDHLNFWYALVQVTTPGTGSAFAAGDLAMLVMVRAAPATTNVYIGTGDYTTVCSDLFQIPADLL